MSAQMPSGQNIAMGSTKDAICGRLNPSHGRVATARRFRQKPVKYEKLPQLTPQ